MAFRKIFCSECGQETQINDEKDVCFCLQCGTKIILRTSREEQLQEQEKPNGQGEQIILDDEVSKKLEEVAFYYQLSNDKQEASKFNSEPVYYLKAQDILVDLSQLYPNDYRVWWELCKPIDFNSASDGVDIYGQYQINEDYFNKALDRAALSEKRVLIEEYDRYVAEKTAVKERAETKRREEEAEKKRREEQERLEEHKQREMQRMQEEERCREQEVQEEERRREQEAQEEEKRRQQQLNEQKGLELSVSLWEALSNKNYSCIDNSYFQFPGENNQTIIGIFKSVSNVMNLMAFHIDSSKGNIVYRDQTISIKFDRNGHGIKFDNSPIKIKGMLPQQNVLFIANNGGGGLTVNGLELCVDQEYVTSIMKNAKKPLIAFSKYFI